MKIKRNQYGMKKNRFGIFKPLKSFSLDFFYLFLFVLFYFLSFSLSKKLFFFISIFFLIYELLVLF